MAKALSIDLRERVLKAVDGGLSCRQAADRFGVSAPVALTSRSALSGSAQTPRLTRFWVTLGRAVEPPAYAC